MNIESKFGLNDKVYMIGFDHKQEWVVCSACAGSGKITLADGRERTCPECYGRLGSHIYLEQEWQIKNTLTIGEVRVSIKNIESDGEFDNIGHYEEGKTQLEEVYMAYETGIGSGTLWNGKNLFSTREEARAECEKRNAEKNVKNT
jgi:hypothetical protein